MRTLLSRLRRPPPGSALTMTGWKRNPDQSALSTDRQIVMSSSLYTLSRSCCRRKPATENPSSRTVGPPHGIRADAVDLDGGNAPARPQQPDILTFEGAASGRDKAFLIEYCGDLLVHFTGPV